MIYSNGSGCVKRGFEKAYYGCSQAKRALHAHAGGGRGLPCGHRFFADVDNVRPTGIVKMRQAI